ncbi:MAG: STAS/SEC14 domain-containing protein [Pseudonocardia sp.]
MIELIEALPEGIVGFRAGATITREEYDRVVVPVIDRAVAAGEHLRALCVVEDGLTLAPSAVWEDVSLGLRAMSLIDGAAVVSDNGLVAAACRVAAVLLPYPLRVFGGTERDAAVAWLRELPGTGFGVESREGGVVVVRVERPLRSADFDRLGDEIDRWCATHAELTGLVLAAPAFPGWENLPGLARHVRFVLERQHHIRRLALAVDGVLPSLAPPVAGAVLHPAVRHFPHADLDAAIAWASEQPAGAGSPTT